VHESQGADCGPPPRNLLWNLSGRWGGTLPLVFEGEGGAALGSVQADQEFIGMSLAHPPLMLARDAQLERADGEGPIGLRRQTLSRGGSELEGLGCRR